ncbi:MAG: hypothetical protein RR769_00820, partial [Anaerovoracaceae bacterium]
MRKKTARKSLIIMLAIVITIAMMPTMAFAEANPATGGGSDTSCGTNLTWSFNNETGTLAIKGAG